MRRHVKISTVVEILGGLIFAYLLLCVAVRVLFGSL